MYHFRLAPLRLLGSLSSRQTGQQNSKATRQQEQLDNRATEQQGKVEVLLRRILCIILHQGVDSLRCSSFVFPDYVARCGLAMAMSLEAIFHVLCAETAALVLIGLAAVGLFCTLCTLLFLGG